MASKALMIYDSQIRGLPEEERVRLVELITRDLAAAGETGNRTRSILELRGLGAEIWNGIDAQAYVDEQRSEWDQRP